MTGTRTGMGWPAWKPVHVTGRKVIQETGSRKLDHRAPSFSVSEGKKTVESQHLCRGAGRYIRAPAESQAKQWLHLLVETDASEESWRARVCFRSVLGVLERQNSERRESHSKWSETGQRDQSNTHRGKAR